MTYTRLVQSYPQFVADQVLTQDQLNNMRIFLDSQNRATRVKLVGIGIVCGLHARIGDIEIIDRLSGEVIEVVQGIIVSEGYGVTSDGWLICIPEKKYIHIQDYTDPDFENVNNIDEPLYRHWRKAYPNDDDNGADNAQILISRLLEEEDVINGSASINMDPISQNNDLRGKALLLYLEINETELKSCYTTDCNNKGQNIQLKVEALLVDKSERFLPGTNQCNELEPIQHVPRFSTALQMVFNKDVSQIDKPSEIKKSYRHVSDLLSKELKDKITDFYNSNEQFFCLSEYSTQLSQLENQLTNLAGEANLSQYNYDILKDISQAYNECVHQACKILKDCCNGEFFPRHLVIRDFEGQEMAKTKGWRHPFYPSAVNNVMHHDLEKVRLLFARLLDLVNSFFLNEELPQEEIKITPSQSEFFPLAKRAIPFYFKDSIENTWQLDDCCNLPSIGYHWNNNVVAESPDYFPYRENPLHYNLNACNFMRIEGHLGLESQGAVTRIKEIRKTHNLDFQIVELPLVKPESPFAIPPNNIISRYQSILKEWKTLYDNIAGGSISDSEYDIISNNIQTLQKDIISANNDWCKGQSAIDLGCDYSHLQADYNILRAELLCMLNACKPAFMELPEIEFEEGGEGSNGEACTDFSVIEIGQRFGEGINQIGDQVINQNDIRVFIDEYTHGETSPPSFGSATVGSFDGIGDRSIFISNINFRFDFNPSQLGFTTDSVEFIFSDFGGSQNLGIDNFKPINVQLIDFKDQVSTIVSMPGFTIEVQDIQQVDTGGNGIKLKGIIRGSAIHSITLGGQEFALFDVCAFGQSQSTIVEPKSLPTFTLEGRFDRIKLLCDLLKKIMHHDIRCFNFPLFQQIIKDFTGAALEIKLWYSCIFKSVNGRFLPYKFYPKWNDFEDCLDHLHKNCLYPRFSALNHIFQNTISASLKSFGCFVEKYPGVEHRAGVSKGGTFIVVHNDENNTNVLADFSLEHFVDDCCSCKIDMEEIQFPPVALADYRIIEIPKAGSQVKIEIPVLENDFSLHDTGIVRLGLLPGKSDKGALLTSDSQTGTVTYEWDNAQEGIDHFTYGIANEHSNDIGHVYIGVFVEGDESTSQEMGKAEGHVFRKGSEVPFPISGAKVELINDNNNVVDSALTRDDGRFSLAAIHGNYSLDIRHTQYMDETFSGQQIIGNESVTLGPFYLSAHTIILNRYTANKVALGKLKEHLTEEPSYALAETFVNDTVANSDLSITKVSKAYSGTTKELIPAIKNAAASKQSKLSELLVLINHSYMDKVVVDNPNKPSTTALTNLKKTNEAMISSGISTKKMLTSWESDQLKSFMDGNDKTIKILTDVFTINT